MKKTLILALIASVSAPAFADQQIIDSLIGAAVGGGGARALYHGSSQRKRNIITAVGALGGAWVGSRIGDDSARRHADQMNMQQQAIDAQYGRDYSRTADFGSTYAVSQPTRRAIRYDDDDYVQPARRATYDQPIQSGECMSEYRDPDAARAYCAGRAAFLRQAYERGARGE